MKAFILNELDAENIVDYQEFPEPDVGPGQVRIQTKAVSLNPVDYKISKGAFGLALPRILGVDVAGAVIEVGEGVSHLTLGDRVCAMVSLYNTGSFAEQVTADANIISKIPEEVGWQEAAVIPCAGITAWQAVVEKINIRQGQTVFITAGGGGVGGFAIQLAKQRGATVITSASKDFERLKDLGADHIINYKEENVLQEVMRVTQNAGVDYMIESISGNNAAAHADMLRYNGIIVCITGLPGEYPFAPFTKAAGMIEVALGAVYVSGDEKSLQDVASAGEQLAQMIAEKKIKPNIGKTISFTDIPQGLKALSQGKVSGKIVAVV